jgi:hypothetical protein
MNICKFCDLVSSGSEFEEVGNLKSLRYADGHDTLFHQKTSTESMVSKKIYDRL